MQVDYGKQIYSISYNCRTIEHKITKAIILKQLSHKPFTLQWRLNGCDGISNHQPHDCLLNRQFMRWSKKPSKFRVTGLCARNSPVTGEFPAQRASNAENVAIRWRHHEILSLLWRFSHYPYDIKLLRRHWSNNAVSSMAGNQAIKLWIYE